jgi:hypothetical protein
MGLGVTNRLSSDLGLKNAIIACNAEITVHTSPVYGCWLITRNSKDAPSAGLWDCYQRVASNLSGTEQKMRDYVPKTR